MEILKLLSVNEIVAQLVCFLIVFLLLRFFLWKAFLKLLDDRKQRVAREFADIDATKAEVQKLRDDFDSQLRSIDEIASGRMKVAVEQGKEAAEEIKDRARQEAQNIVSEAKAEIEQTVVKTKEELKRQVVELTLMATEKIIEQKLTEDSDRKLITKFIDQLEKDNA